MSSNLSASSKPYCRYLIVARHGERLDYVRRDAGDPWTPTASRPYDPPLTEHGLAQAAKLGQHLKGELQRRGIPPITTVYTSPFLRCRQTAVAAAAQLDAPVRVEFGLCESFNESWFRSWALPGTDGTWGYRMPPDAGNVVVDADLAAMDPQLFHVAARRPVQALPLFTDFQTETDSTAVVDTSYTSQTTIPEPYSLHPLLLETRKAQATRMLDVVEKTANDDCHTVMLTSHGAPVQHLFGGLTGKSWQEHGPSVYCCYSIYQSTTTSDNDDNGDAVWKPIVVNESAYLDEQLQGDNYMTPMTTGNDENATK